MCTRHRRRQAAQPREIGDGGVRPDVGMAPRRAVPTVCGCEVGHSARSKYVPRSGI
ncbi:hypothetical protein F01_420808 [Burkholderia cenocepacia]|nr:hypothetical protein F01_420808 [Burkholderia cenocepacia]